MNYKYSAPEIIVIKTDGPLMIMLNDELWSGVEPRSLHRKTKNLDDSNEVGKRLVIGRQRKVGLQYFGLKYTCKAEKELGC